MTDLQHRTCEQTQVDESGIHYRSCGNSHYLSLNYHRSHSGTRDKKSVWAIPRPQECHTFCTAEAESWIDGRGNYWAVAATEDENLGEDGERVAFFENPNNPNNPWHGFPVGRRRGKGHPYRDSPPDDLVLKWRSSGRISYVEQQRILTRRR